jgi:predicted transcriptional regulator
MAIKCTKWPQYITNGQIIYQFFPIPRLSKIYPNLDFWFEKTPSGNPDYFMSKIDRNRCYALTQPKFEEIYQSPGLTKKLYPSGIRFHDREKIQPGA